MAFLACTIFFVCLLVAFRSNKSSTTKRRFASSSRRRCRRRLNRCAMFRVAVQVPQMQCSLCAATSFASVWTRFRHPPKTDKLPRESYIDLLFYQSKVHCPSRARTDLSYVALRSCSYHTLKPASLLGTLDWLTLTEQVRCRYEIVSGRK